MVVHIRCDEARNRTVKYDTMPNDALRDGRNPQLAGFEDSEKDAVTGFVKDCGFFGFPDALEEDLLDVSGLDFD